MNLWVRVGGWTAGRGEQVVASTTATRQHSAIRRIDIEFSCFFSWKQWNTTRKGTTRIVNTNVPEARLATLRWDQFENENYQKTRKRYVWGDTVGSVSKLKKIWKGWKYTSGRICGSAFVGWYGGLVRWGGMWGGTNCIKSHSRAKI